MKATNVGDLRPMALTIGATAFAPCLKSLLNVNGDYFNYQRFHLTKKSK